MRQMWMVLTGLLAGALLAGCRPAATGDAPELPLAGQNVEICVPSDLTLQDLWEPILQEWKAQTGGTVTWTSYDPADPPWKQRDASLAASSNGRVLLLPLTALSEAETAGLLTPFPPNVVEAIDEKDLFPGLKDAVLCRQKTLMAVPVSAPVLLCYYRKDLLEASGRQPPQTWDEYQQLVEQLDQWAPGLSAVEPCGPEFRSSLFLARCAAFCKHPQNYSAWFDIQTGEPFFNTPGFEKALEIARNTWSRMPEEIWTMSPRDCRRALLTGKSAMTLTYEPAGAYPSPLQTADPNTDVSGETKDPLPIGVVTLPGSPIIYHRDAKRWDEPSKDAPYQPGFTGFTGLILGIHAEQNSSAAWHLLQTLVQHQHEAFAGQPQSPCRESDVSIPWSEDHSVSVETASLIVDGVAQTLRRREVVCDLAIPGAAALRELISTELAAARQTDKSSQELLAELQAKVISATQDRREKLRDEYRRSLGLSPLRTPANN